MKTIISAVAVLLAFEGVLAGSVIRRAIDNTQAAGTNPITTFTSQFLGKQTAANSCSRRDLGFVGEIAGKYYALYGDTLWCDAGITDPAKETDGFHGMVRDAISELTNDPLKVNDLFLNGDTPVPHQKQFVPYNSAWGETGSTGFGGTSLAEVDKDSATGLVYYLVNQNDAGLVGAGVGKVVVQNGVPVVTQRYGEKGYWWPSGTVARYGDVATFRDPHSDYIYSWGGTPTSITGLNSLYAYQARVLRQGAFDLSQYEYWHGRAKGWSKDPIQTYDSESAVFWGVGQGQAVWSPYFNCYLFVYIPVGSDKIAIKSAPKPEGPWSEGKEVYTIQKTSDNLIYAPAVQYHLDPSGQTLVVHYTFMPNDIQVVRISFTGGQVAGPASSAVVASSAKPAVSSAAAVQSPIAKAPTQPQASSAAIAPVASSAAAAKSSSIVVAAPSSVLVPRPSSAVAAPWASYKPSSVAAPAASSSPVSLPSTLPSPVLVASAVPSKNATRPSGKPRRKHCGSKSLTV